MPPVDEILWKHRMWTWKTGAAGKGRKVLLKRTSPAALDLSLRQLVRRVGNRPAHLFGCLIIAPSQIDLILAETVVVSSNGRKSERPYQLEFPSAVQLLELLQ